MTKFCVVIPGEPIDEVTKADLKAKFEANQGCRWCGGLHPGECPRLRKIVFHPNDERVIREIEFWADADWSRSQVVFPEDVVLWVCLTRTFPRTRSTRNPLT